MASQQTHLLVISERQALAWILRNDRMAFPALRGPSLSGIEVGDTFLLLTTRGCFHSPRRDGTRIIGTARVASRVGLLDQEVEVAGRSFAYGCDIAVETLTAFRQGVELAPVVDDLEVFPHKHAWSVALRRSVVTLPGEDVRLLHRLLAKVAQPVEEHRNDYLDQIKPVQAQGRRR